MPRRLFLFADVRPDEERVVGRAALGLLCIVAAHTLLETTRDALFLAGLPRERLLWVYVVLAAAAGLVSRVSTRFVQRFGSRAGLAASLAASAYGAGLFYVLPKGSATVFSLYVFTGVISAVAVVQFWMLVGDWFTVAQGRRLFGVIALGGVLGALLGAFGAVLLLRWFGVEVLLPLAAALFLAAAWNLAGTRREQGDADVERARQEPLRDAAREVAANPYVRYLAALAFVSSSALLVLDYLFKSVAAASIAGPELGQFFAGYYAVLNACALLIQTFAVTLSVRRLGVVATGVIMPALLLLGGTSVVASGAALVLVLLTKAADAGLRHSLQRTAFELLWLPLAESVRSATKTFVDTVVIRTAQAVTAAALLLLSERAWDTSPVLGGLVALLAALWLVLALRVRSPYRQLFRMVLRSPRAVEERLWDADAVSHLVEALASRDSGQALSALELFRAHSLTHLIPALVLYHEDSRVLIAALDIMATPKRADWVALARRLVAHEDPEVRVAAMRALTRADFLDAAEERLNDVRPEVRGQAGFLLERQNPMGDPMAHPALADVLSLDGEAGARARVGLLAAVRDAADPRYVGFVVECLERASDAVREHAIATMTALRDARFVAPLVAGLERRAGRSLVRRALVQQGDLALPELERQLCNTNLSLRHRCAIPAALLELGTPRAFEIVLAEIQREHPGAVRYKLLLALAGFVAERGYVVPRLLARTHLERELVEHFRMKRFARTVGESASSRALLLLRDLLQEKALQARERAFRWLQMIHTGEDIRALEQALSSADVQQQASATEFLDELAAELGSARIRRLLLALVDAEDPRAAREAEDLPDVPRKLDEVVSQLLQGRDPVLQSIAFAV